ncbi:hypothetical protein E4U43_003078 [Claviceps pusilla]|uniref:Methyltransferase type 11 domain-containing protein n=1 Tax=Claviceps pusilla TaxID=123648 RepID=A0A9P7N587_9HYPO|nr:hypothetical protein E4U43_003078 [Claviceps pusilla]
MSGGLMDTSIGRSKPNASHLATEHGASSAAASTNGHSVVSPMTTASSTITSAPSDLDDVFSPEAKKEERDDFLPTKYNYQGPFERIVVDGIRCPSGLQSPIRQSFNFSNGHSHPSPTRLTYAAKYTMINGDHQDNPIPPARSPLRPATQKSHGATKSINNASSWRRPRDWTLMTLISPPNRPTETVSGDEAKELVKEVENMARAPPAVALAKLKQPYNSSMSLEDHQKLSDEKERWMLSALQHLDQHWQQHTVKDFATTEAFEVEPKEQQKPRLKLLAFYEPQSNMEGISSVSARYLAAYWPNKDIHHLSDRPLSFKSAPNLRAIFKPSICTPFPELTATFDTVHSMLLPALCKESEVLAVLNSINKCLKPGGSLNLVIIDSIPHVDAFGAKMRAWFMKNIVLNLQQQSRCLNPSLSLPDLLSKASLRGPGSILTTTQFYANPQNISRHGVEHDWNSKSDRQDKEVRAELRSLAGRMFWKEVWGQFVTSDTWWWEEDECMQECLELGTFWEYHSVQAVKAH